MISIRRRAFLRCSWKVDAEAVSDEFGIVCVRGVIGFIVHRCNVALVCAL